MAATRSKTRAAVPTNTLLGCVKVTKVAAGKRASSTKAKKKQAIKPVEIAVLPKTASASFVSLRIPKVRSKFAPIPKHLQRNGKFAFGHNPIWHRGHKTPSRAQFSEVLTILVEYHKEHPEKPFDIPLTADTKPMGESALERPGHAPIGITIDNIVKVVFSQATKNENAISAHDILRSRFTYDVDGTSYVGTVPNYHKMRLCPEAELREIIRPGGLYTVRAKGFLELLNMVHKANCARQGLPEDVDSANEKDAKDFVAGLLSLEYLNGMEKGELMDYLLKISNIGVKTAACILAFNFRMDVFAVDIHVLHMVRLLGWIPEDLKDRDKACMYLDNVIPDGLKYGLHQAFWHHRVHCLRCQFYTANAGRRKSWTTATCPLEHLCNRDLSPIEKGPRRSGSSSSNTVTEEDNDDESRDSDEPQSKSKPKSKKSPKEKSKASYMPFSKMKPDKAYETGYVLTTSSIDNDFNVSGLYTNKTAMWILETLVHKDRVLTLADAKEQGLIPHDTKAGKTQKSIGDFFSTSKKGTKVEDEETGQTGDLSGEDSGITDMDVDMDGDTTNMDMNN